MDVPDFGVIYTEYFSDVYKYMLSLCRNKTIAEEIAQESFFKAMKHIDRFNGDCTLYVWLCQIAKNTYFTFLSKQKRVEAEFDIEYQDISLEIENSYLDKEATKNLHILWNRSFCIISKLEMRIKMKKLIWPRILFGADVIGRGYLHPLTFLKR